MDMIEASKSSRAACRQCGAKIQKGELRFGEEFESEYGTSHRWYHLPCAAKKLPALLKKTLEGYDGEVENREELLASTDAKPVVVQTTVAVVATLPKEPKTNDKIEEAKSSRSKCRQCGEKIEKGTQRFGEEFESEYGLSFRWYHLPCAAKKLPALFGNTLGHHEGKVDNREELLALLGDGDDSAPQEILPDYPDVSMAPTSRASCIQCREKIEKGAQRIAVEIDLEIRGRMSRGAGYMHAPCVGVWLGENEDVDAAEFNRIIVAKGGVAAKATAPTASDLPGLGPVTSMQLRALSKKLVKLKDEYRISDYIRENVEYSVSEQVVWHLIAHDALDVGKNIYLLKGPRKFLDYDGRKTPDDVDRRTEHLDTLLKALMQIPSKPDYESDTDFPSLPTWVVEIGMFLVRSAPDKAREIFPSLKPNVQVAISLPMLLHDMELPEGAADGLTDSMANLIGHHPLTLYPPGQDRDEIVLDVDALIERLGNQERWLETCVKVMKKTEARSITGLKVAIVKAAKAPLFSTLESLLNYHSKPKEWVEIRGLLSKRDDLDALAKDVAKPKSKASEKLKLLLIPLAKGPVKGAEDTLEFSNLSDNDELPFVPEYEAVMRAVGQERALAAGERALSNEDIPVHQKGWGTLLSRIYGDAASDLLTRLIELSRSKPRALRHAGIAPRACLAEIQKHDDLMEKSELFTSIAVAFALTGEEIPAILDDAIASRPYDFPKYAHLLSDERWIRIIDMALAGANPPGQVIQHVKVSSVSVRRHCVEQLVERRKKIKKQYDGRAAFLAVDPNAELLLPLLSKVDADEKKFFRVLEKTYDKVTFAKVCDAVGKKVETRAEKLLSLAAAKGAKQPVLFYPAKGDLEPLKVETLSYHGDAPPPEVKNPAGVEEDMKHILTFDLSPFPALVKQFGHETMSLFVEAPNSGEFNDDAVLIGSPKLSAIPEGGKPMAIGAIELPAKLRKRGKSSDASALRSVIGGLDAHAFGPAYWIQQNQGDTVTLQLNDSFMNLGDTGSLYIGDFGTTWQCY
ncbi:MAG: hypothetical protein ACI9KE_003436 [Polyangiales bacterium]|jgi:hypothetical protein